MIETYFLCWKRCCPDQSFSVSPWTKHCQLKAVGEDNFAHPRCVMHHIRLQSRSTFTLTHQISCPLSPSMITIKHRRSSKTRNTLTEKWLLEYLPNSSKYLLSIFLILPSKSVLNVLENWLWFPLCMKLQKKLEINEWKLLLEVTQLS